VEPDTPAQATNCGSAVSHTERRAIKFYRNNKQQP